MIKQYRTNDKQQIYIIEEIWEKGYEKDKQDRIEEIREK